MAQSFHPATTGGPVEGPFPGLRGDRLKAALAAALLHAGLAYLLLSGFAVTIVRQVSDNIKTFTVIEAPPPQAEADIPNPSDRKEERDAEGTRASPAAKPAAAPVSAPQPPLILPPLQPVVAAPVPAEGSKPDTGTSAAPRAGTDSVSEGSGTGSGVEGSGSGGGVAVAAERIKGRIRGSDYPNDAYRRHAAGTVFLRLTIAADGRVSHCVVDESSGHPDLDSATCALILKRYRYRPARDARGQPVPDTVNLAQVWETSRR